MSWKRCSGFLMVTPMYCWASGQGLRRAARGVGGGGGGASAGCAHARCGSCATNGAAGAPALPCQRTRRPPERVVEVEEALLGLEPQERGHVLEVGQRGRQAHQAHHLLGGLRGGQGGQGGVGGGSAARQAGLADRRAHAHQPTAAHCSSCAMVLLAPPASARARAHKGRQVGRAALAQPQGQPCRCAAAWLPLSAPLLT